MELHRTTGNWRLGLGLSLITVVLWGLVPVALAIVLTKLDTYTINWFCGCNMGSNLPIWKAASVARK